MAQSCSMLVLQVCLCATHFHMGHTFYYYWWYQHYNPIYPAVNNSKQVTYKTNHTKDNESKFKQKLSDVRCEEVLDNNNADVDYNEFIKTFDSMFTVL